MPRKYFYPRNLIANIGEIHPIGQRNECSRGGGYEMKGDIDWIGGERGRR